MKNVANLAAVEPDDRDLLLLIEPAHHGAPYVKTAIDLGVRPVVVRRSKGPPNPLPLESDSVIVRDIENVDDVVTSVEPLLAGRKQRIGVLPGNEWMVPVAAAVADRLGLSGNRPSAALVARDKLNMRLAFLQAGVPAPHLLRVFASLRAAHFGAEHLRYPVIVKPTDMACSLYVRLAWTPQELAEQVQAILSVKRPPGGYATRRIALVEEYVEGPEFSVEVFLHNGEGVFASVTEKEKGPLPYFVELGHVVPADLSEIVTDRLRSAAVKAALSLGLTQGPCHVELILDGETPKVVELAARLGGDNITHLLRLAGAGGVDLHRAAVLQALGRDPRATDHLRPLQRAAAVRFLTGTPGTVSRIHGVPAPCPEEIPVIALPKRGQVVRPLHSGDDRLGYVIAVGSDPAEARGRARQIADGISFV